MKKKLKKTGVILLAAYSLLATTMIGSKSSDEVVIAEEKIEVPEYKLEKGTIKVLVPAKKSPKKWEDYFDKILIEAENGNVYIDYGSIEDFEVGDKVLITLKTNRTEYYFDDIVLDLVAIEE